MACTIGTSFHKAMYTYVIVTDPGKLKPHTVRKSSLLCMIAINTNAAFSYVGKKYTNSDTSTNPHFLNIQKVTNHT